MFADVSRDIEEIKNEQSSSSAKESKRNLMSIDTYSELQDEEQDCNRSSCSECKIDETNKSVRESS